MKDFVKVITWLLILATLALMFVGGTSLIWNNLNDKTVCSLLTIVLGLFLIVCLMFIVYLVD